MKSEISYSRWSDASLVGGWTLRWSGLSNFNGGKL